MQTELTIHSISHTADGYKVTYTVHRHGAKTRVTMVIPYTSIPHENVSVEKMIRAYLLEHLAENN